MRHESYLGRECSIDFVTSSHEIVLRIDKISFNEQMENM